MRIIIAGVEAYGRGYKIILYLYLGSFLHDCASNNYLSGVYAIVQHVII